MTNILTKLLKLTLITAFLINVPINTRHGSRHGYYGRRRHHNGSSGGAIAAGVLGAAAITALATSSSRNDDSDYNNQKNYTRERLKRDALERQIDALQKELISLKKEIGQIDNKKQQRKINKELKKIEENFDDLEDDARNYGGNNFEPFSERINTIRSDIRMLQRKIIRSQENIKDNENDFNKVD
jgi:predicted acylesterase/phospholipase RssA